MKLENKRFEGDDFTELKNLWLRVFDENEEALELFFNRNKMSFVPYCSTCNGKIISALYLLPCTLNGENAHYLCGAATAPEYRRRGIASALTSRLALEIISLGKVPFYCAAWSNIRSARNAVKSGFRPAWAELTARDSGFVKNMMK